MKFSFPMTGFAPFKVVMGAFFLGLFVLLSDKTYAIGFTIALLVGKAHALGAWAAMWKANKLNWIYVSWMTFFVLFVTYVGIYVLTFKALNVITILLFMIHFLFDEYILQEEKKTFENLIAPIFIAALFAFYTLEYMGVFVFPFSFYLVVFGLGILLEAIFVREITWQHLNMKILGLFFLFSVYMKLGIISFTVAILLWHYFFWFIYPVYKLHKYKREERDGLIFMLILIVLSSVFLASNSGMVTEDLKDFAIRYFNIITIVHVLGTAPFGHWFGLPGHKHVH